MDYNQETVSTFDRSASVYAEKYFDLRQYDRYYEAFLESLPEGAVSILDLACGPGNVSAFIKSRRADADILAADRSDGMLEQVRARVSGVATVNIDCRDLSYIGRTFHGVVFFFGLSYFNNDDAAKVLDQILAKLHPGGTLLLASVAGDPSLSGVQTNKSRDQVFSFFRRPSEITAMVASSGFEVISASKVDSPANASINTTDSIVIARRPNSVS